MKKISVHMRYQSVLGLAVLAILLFVAVLIQAAPGGGGAPAISLHSPVSFPVDI